MSRTRVNEMSSGMQVAATSHDESQLEELQIQAQQHRPPAHRRDRRPTRQPGAFAVAGADATGEDEEFSTTAPASHPVSTAPVITAQLVNDNDDDYELLQEQLRQRDEQLERVLVGIENAAVAQVVLPDEEAQENLEHESRWRGKTFFGRKCIVVVGIISAIVAIVLGVVITRTLSVTQASPEPGVAEPTKVPTTAQTTPGPVITESTTQLPAPEPTAPPSPSTFTPPTPSSSPLVGQSPPLGLCPEKYAEYHDCFRSELTVDAANACDACVASVLFPSSFTCEGIQDSICSGLRTCTSCSVCADEVERYLDCFISKSALGCSINCNLVTGSKSINLLANVPSPSSGTFSYGAIVALGSTMASAAASTLF